MFLNTLHPDFANTGAHHSFSHQKVKYASSGLSVRLTNQTNGSMKKNSTFEWINLLGIYLKPNGTLLLIDLARVCHPAINLSLKSIFTRLEAIFEPYLVYKNVILQGLTPN